MTLREECDKYIRRVQIASCEKYKFFGSVMLFMCPNKVIYFVLWDFSHLECMMGEPATGQ